MKLLLIFFIACVLGSCQKKNATLVQTCEDNTTIFSGQAMTMAYKLIVGRVLDSDEILEVENIIKDTFHEIDSIHNKWNPNSEISQLNRIKANVWVPISPSLEKLLEQTHEVVKLSKGRFDPTIEPLQAIWKRKLQQGILPEPMELASITPALGWDKIHFKNGLFSKSHELTQLDLGGIAKGYCIDILSERLFKKGFLDVFVEWGGEIRALGKHPSGRSWTIFISRLGNADPSKAVTMLALEDQAIATSGDYLQNWSVRKASPDGSSSTITYFHIFDPDTYFPRIATYTSIASASVAAPNCTLADGLATAAMMFPSIEDATIWVEEIKSQYPELSFWLISREQINCISGSFAPL